jgi:hypothetical protein
MTDDIVKRLRGYCDGDACLAPVSTKEMIDSAADRIEELEKALRLIANTDPAGDQHWPGRIARFVLDGGTDD